MTESKKSFDPILWNSAVVSLRQKMIHREKGKKPVEAAVFTKTKKIATRNKKPAINIIPSNEQFVELDLKKAVVEKQQFEDLLRWGTLDLHVPKEMAIYNGDGTRFLKNSLTKTNKLSKFQNQSSIRFKPITDNRNNPNESSGGTESKPILSDDDLINRIYWDMQQDYFLFPTLKFVKQLKLNGKKFFTKEDYENHKKEPTRYLKGRFRREIVYNLFHRLNPDYY
jgi:hypothetical protein